MKIKNSIAHTIPNMKLGIASFTDPRSEVHLISQREDYIRKNHLELKQRLESEGFMVVDPQTERRKNQQKSTVWGINNLDEVKLVGKEFVQEKIGALILGCWAWNEPNIPLELAKEVKVPIALVTKNDPLWPGVTALTSTGATFWQLASNKFIATHKRFLVSSEIEYQSLISWLKASCVINYLRAGTLLLWGGTPALNMEHLNEDTLALQGLLINEVITENQNVLIERVEVMLKNNPNRITNFIKWLTDNGCQIIYDNKMTTKESVTKQIALYFAARDLISERLDKNESIIGASIKCQPELSIDYTVTGCLIPAFLPFSSDSEGEKPIIPTVCEGDIKGLLTSAILYGLNYSIPPLFGDLKVLTDDYFVIANCGGASAFYAANSNDPQKTLSKSAIKPQCQGETGGAFGFYTPASNEEVTYARIFRIAEKFYLQFGVGKILTNYKKPIEAWGESWPHTVVDLKIPKELFIKAVGTNHLSLTLGNFKDELRNIAEILSIEIVELDKIESVESFLQKLGK